MKESIAELKKIIKEQDEQICRLEVKKSNKEIFVKSFTQTIILFSFSIITLYLSSMVFLSIVGLITTFGKVYPIGTFFGSIVIIYLYSFIFLYFGKSFMREK